MVRIEYGLGFGHMTQNLPAGVHDNTVHPDRFERPTSPPLALVHELVKHGKHPEAAATADEYEGGRPQVLVHRDHAPVLGWS